MIYGSWVDSRALALAESVSYLWLLAALHAEERRVVGSLAVHQRHKTEVGEFLLAAVGDGHLGRALHGNVAFVGGEVVGGQAFDQSAAFNTAHGYAHAVK